jgi:hypothetical protein
MNTKHRFKALSISVFGVTLSAILFAQKKFALDPSVIFGQYAPLAVVALSLLSYDMVYKLSILAIDKFAFLKKLYWRSLYLDGLWSYTSRSERQEFFGVWRIQQDVLGLNVVAFGLTSDFHRRSTVKSVSDIFGENGVFDVINDRWDLSAGNRHQFSHTRLVPDQPIRHGVFYYPDVIRGETTIYGSNLDGEIAYDLRMIRRTDCRTEEDLIAKLKQERGGQAAAKQPVIPLAAEAGSQHGSSSA